MRKLTTKRQFTIVSTDRPVRGLRQRRFGRGALALPLALLLALFSFGGFGLATLGKPRPLLSEVRTGFQFVVLTRVAVEKQDRLSVFGAHAVKLPLLAGAGQARYCPLAPMGTIKKWLFARASVYGDFSRYLNEVKQTGWELLWGPGFIAILFSTYAVVFSMRLCVFLLGLAVACVVAGYLIWRPYYLRFTPQLEFTKDLFLQEVLRGSQKIDQKIEVVCFIQILPKCLTESAIMSCEARLLRVRSLTDGNWIERFKEPLLLTWSVQNTALCTLYPEVPQRLNVATVSHRFGFVPEVMSGGEERFVFNENGPLRFDVVVLSKDHPAITITVEAKVIRWGNGRTSPEVEACLLSDEKYLDTDLHYERRSDN